MVESIQSTWAGTCPEVLCTRDPCVRGFRHTVYGVAKTHDVCDGTQWVLVDAGRDGKPCAQESAHTRAYGKVRDDIRVCGMVRGDIRACGMVRGDILVYEMVRGGALVYVLARGAVLVYVMAHGGALVYVSAHGAVLVYVMVRDGTPAYA
ncbi:unnamed protein product [Acanthoscelides obtectus]|uniref:Uncharacterized protein n=1 Tax=Acanthoscelides obtectus TaxID=200917 RepID=A0A9P0PV40_ACAOB|nr:unnamed protein product [Acanthoscelides obtectus]CAK1635391.1 hypothetical protein AOBTE_LOCUS9247 [Acanthoscelides obtectus]